MILRDRGGVDREVVSLCVLHPFLSLHPCAYLDLSVLQVVLPLNHQDHCAQLFRARDMATFHANDDDMVLFLVVVLMGSVEDDLVVEVKRSVILNYPPNVHVSVSGKGRGNEREQEICDDQYPACPHAHYEHNHPSASHPYLHAIP